MDRLSLLFRTLAIAVVLLLTGMTGTALGHPVANVALPAHYLYWLGIPTYLQFEGYSGEFDYDFSSMSINEEEKNKDVKIIEHTVVKGESISSISRDYGVDENTILHNNNISNPNLIVLGQELRFPSIDGIIYQIKSGDTLGQIANIYQTTVEEILDVNVVVTTQLTIGTTIILPNAKPVSLSSSAVSRSGSVASLRNLRWPVNGVITSSYGWRRNPFNTSQTQFHRGLDIGASRGTPIRAATAGEVILSRWQNGYGYTVIVKHGNDYTLYAHASSLSVSKGQWVTQGQEIAKVGATGNATGPHLHFEVRVQGNDSARTVNPINYLTTR